MEEANELRKTDRVLDGFWKKQEEPSLKEK